MPTSIRLDFETSSLLDRLARDRGTTRSEIIREAIRLLPRPSELDPTDPTAYDRLVPFIGCVDSGGSNRSARAGEGFRTPRLEMRRARHPD